MNRRGFLRSLFASVATIVVAPADVFADLPPSPGDPHRTYVDMGRNVAEPGWPDLTPFRAVITGDIIVGGIAAAAMYYRRHHRELRP